MPTDPRPSAALLAALREEADLSEKGIDFMDDEDLANETRVQIGLLRDAASEIERLRAALDELLDVAERMRGGDSGIPTLREMAEAQGPAACRALDAEVSRAMELLPV